MLALGSNLGDRRLHLELAVRRLGREGAHVVSASRLFETRPLAGSDGSAYLNACLLVETRLGPFDLLARCQSIEREGGRLRRDRWGARPIDLDLIFFGPHRITGARLQLPHPGWKQRDFVLAGLLDLGIERAPVPMAGESPRIRHWLAGAENCILAAHSWPFPRSVESSPAR